MTRATRAGATLFFSVGPPFCWLPRLFRSKLGFGWSACWLWFGLYGFYISAGTLAIDGAFPRCSECQQFARREDLTLLTHEDGRASRLCGACLPVRQVGQP